MTKYGGPFIVGDTEFWLDHEAYLEMVVVLGDSGPFMFSGTVDGVDVERWVGSPVDTHARLGELVADPSLPDDITIAEHEAVIDKINVELADHERLLIRAPGRGLDFSRWIAH